MVAWLRPRLEDRRFPVAGPAAARDRGQPLPRLRLRPPRRTGRGLDKLPARLDGRAPCSWFWKLDRLGRNLAHLVNTVQGPGAALGHALQLRAGERGVGNAAAGLLRAGESGLVAAPREGRGSGTTSRPTTVRLLPSTPTSRRAGLEEPKVALFQTVDPAARRLTGRALDRRLVLAMIKRRPAAAGLPPSTCCHTFRATGITAYLSNGGTLEHAQQIAGHASPKTTKLYDRAARQARSRETGMGSARSIHSPAIPGRDLAERQPGGFAALEEASDPSAP